MGAAVGLEATVGLVVGVIRSVLYSNDDDKPPYRMEYVGVGFTVGMAEGKNPPVLIEYCIEKLFNVVGAAVSAPVGGGVYQSRLFTYENWFRMENGVGAGTPVPDRAAPIYAMDKNRQRNNRSFVMVLSLVHNQSDTRKSMTDAINPNDRDRSLQSTINTMINT